MRRLLLTMAVAVVLAACSTDDGRQLADPDPDLTRVTTTAPTATGEAARGGAASEFAVPVSSTGPGGLTVSSPRFAAGAAIPVEHTCDGDEREPSFAWTGNDADRPLALVVRDADAQGAVHWIVTGLRGPAGVVDPTTDDAGTSGVNSFDVIGWTGPCPDDDLEHRYVFTLYALPGGSTLPTGAAEELVAAIEELHLGASTVLGVYARP